MTTLLTVIIVGLLKIEWYFENIILPIKEEQHKAKIKWVNNVLNSIK